MTQVKFEKAGVFYHIKKELSKFGNLSGIDIDGSESSTSVGFVFDGKPKRESVVPNVGSRTEQVLAAYKALTR